MEKFTIREAIEMAVQAERLGYQFYTDMTERFKRSKKLKDLFKESLIS